MLIETAQARRLTGTSERRPPRRSRRTRVRYAGQEPRGHQELVAGGNGRQHVAEHEHRHQSEQQPLPCPRAERRDHRRTDHDTDRVRRDEVTGGRDRDVHPVGDLRQQPHGHGLGGPDRESPVASANNMQARHGARWYRCRESPRLVTADCRIHRQPSRTDVTLRSGRWPWEHPAWTALATISWASTCRACCKEPGRRSPPTWLDWSPRRPGSCRSRRWDTSCRAQRQRRDRAGEPGRVRPLAAGTADARGSTERDLSCTILGTPMPAPVLVAPIGVQTLAHPDGELATARAADALGLTYTLDPGEPRVRADRGEQQVVPAVLADRSRRLPELPATCESQWVRRSGRHPRHRDARLATGRSGPRVPAVPQGRGAGELLPVTRPSRRSWSSRSRRTRPRR